MMTLAACGGNDSATTIAVSADGTEAAAVIRYVDLDTISAKYNLSVELNEALLTQYNSLDEARRRKATELQNLANDIEYKYKNNVYLSQQKFDEDQQKLANKQREAQNYLTDLEREFTETQEQYRTQVLDSVVNYLKVLAEANGYDMILNKAAAGYIAPKYDVTESVIEELNKRHTKVEKQ